MKALKTICITIIVILITSASFFWAAKQGMINRQLQNITNFYLKTKGINLKIKGIDFNNNDFKISEIRFYTQTGTTKILNLTGKWGIGSYSLNLDIKDGELNISTDGDLGVLRAQLATSNISLGWSNKIINSNVELIKIRSDVIKDINNNLIENGTASISIGAETKGGIKFSENEYLMYNQSPEKPEIYNIKIHNFPLLIHKILPNFIPKSKLVDFCSDFIQNGFINDLEIIYNQNSEESKKSTVLGEGKISNLELNYGNEFPNLKSMNLDLKIKGNNIDFFIDQAYSSEILLKSGNIAIDWRGQDKTIIYIKSAGKGPVTSLIDFVNPSTLEALKKGDIDLRKIKGDANILVEVAVPLKERTENRYNISAQIPNAKLSIFRDIAWVDNMDISGKFDGNQVIIKGTGLINNFNSTLDFIHNIEKNSDGLEFDNEMIINIDLSANNLHKQQKKPLPFIDFLGGGSAFNLHYTNKEDDHNVTAKSDLTNLDLYFDKLGVHKKQGESAELLVNGKFKDLVNGNIDLKIKGDNNLEISSNISFKENDIELKFHKIKHDKTNLTGEVHFTNQKLNANLSGRTLDLSKANFLQFLEKEQEGTPTSLIINLDKIILKNNVILQDINLNLECDSIRCFKGSMYSALGQKKIIMNLEAENDIEKWHFTAGSVGKILSGLGLYENLHDGNIDLDLEMSRKLVKSGQIIPIINGSFKLKHFMLSKTPILTKLATFVSVPGFLNMIRGKNDILFYEMNGNFSFNDCQLKINNSFARGPFFDFQLKGNIHAKDRTLDINGFVNPSLYGVSYIVDHIPIVNMILIGSKNRRGLISAPYKIQESF